METRIAQATAGTIVADICRLEYHSKQENFHMADINDERFDYTGWHVLMEKIPESVALEFIEYADDKLLSTNVYYTWKAMQKELHKWLSK